MSQSFHKHVIDEAAIVPSVAWDLAQPTPGAQVPPVIGVDFGDPAIPGGMTATMDKDGNVRMEATLTPADRAVLREVARDQAITHAEKIGCPVGLRGLFPSNLVRTKLRRK